MPKSLTVIIKKHLLPADEALHPETIAQVRHIKKSCKKVEIRGSKGLGKWGRMKKGSSEGTEMCW